MIPYQLIDVNSNGFTEQCFVIEVIGTTQFVIPRKYIDTDPALSADVTAFNIANGPYPKTGGVANAHTFITTNGTPFYDTYHGLIKVIVNDPNAPTASFDTVDRDHVETATITAINAPGFTSILANSHLDVGTTGKGTVTIQVTGTWATVTGGIYVQVTVDGTTWLTLSNPSCLLDVSNMDFDSLITSGSTGIWQVETIGYLSVRFVAIGTTLTGSINIIARTSTNVRTIFSTKPGLPYTKFLTTVGDGTGTNNLIGDYSGAVTSFWYGPTTNQKFYITTVCVQISDNATFNQTDYGGIVNGLTNGVTFFVKISGVEIPLLSQITFKQNHDWFGLTAHNVLTTWAGTDQTLNIEFAIDQDFDIPLVLDGANGGQFIIKLHDNFTSLVAHRFILRGRLV